MMQSMLIAFNILIDAVNTLIETLSCIEKGEMQSLNHERGNSEKVIVRIKISCEISHRVPAIYSRNMYMSLCQGETGIWCYRCHVQIIANGVENVVLSIDIYILLSRQKDPL